jgi:hypothetical protein
VRSEQCAVKSRLSIVDGEHKPALFLLVIQRSEATKDLQLLFGKKAGSIDPFTNH